MVAVVLLAGCAGGAGVTPQLSLRADPVPLPAPRQLADTTLDEFEGMLAGVRGRPVVVNVWASWCGPCRVEAPLLQRAAERYGGDVVFIGVDSKDTRRDGSRFLNRYGIDYPNVFDASGDIRRALGLRGFPTTYVFGRDGRLRATVVGGISEQTLAAHVSAAARA